MKSLEERMREFAEYHKNGDGECNNVVLKAWAAKHRLSLQERYELAYYFAITYCVESAIVLFREQADIFPDIKLWVERKKDSIVFQSDRKYVRMRDSFEKCLEQFKSIRSVEGFLGRVSDGTTIILAKAIPYVENWVMFGRFSAFLFLETFVNLTGIPIENTTISWKQGNTATSGLLNLYGLDDAANEFDKHKRLRVSTKLMDDMLRRTLVYIGKTGGSTNVTEVETSLCAYRKFYKGSRYNGFYLDRMLEEINKMSRQYPEISKELIEIRKAHFDEKYLGEIGGWAHVRGWLKKVYRETGLVT